MKSSLISELHKQFEALVKVEEEKGTEFWCARDLQAVLGYAKWESFLNVIKKAKVSCENSGSAVDDHFLDIRKMVQIGSDAVREIGDIALTRYACYLIAQNGEPSKDPIAFAQAYFAVQTRKQEVVERRLAETERIEARRKLTESEKQLSGLIFEKLGDGQSFGRIRSKGDQALFGGKTTQQMKDGLGVPKSRTLADFLPTITIKAKDFANEITVFSVQRDNINSEAAITSEHVKNNSDVRGLLLERSIVPEELPPAEDAKKVERRLKAEEKRLSLDAESLEGLAVDDASDRS